MTSPRFEGSYLGAGAKISAAAVLECKICWHVYDPASGDDTRQISPGTPFTALPHDWTCPGCGAAAEQFMVLRDEGVAPDAMEAAIARLEADFREIYNGKMRDVPLCNHSLHVQAVGFQPWAGHYLGVLIAPWFMNLVLLAGPDDNWTALEPGRKQMIGFPSGQYEFIHNAREQVGGYKACSLFSPMNDFNSQMQAVDVARAIMLGLFDPDVLERLEDAAQPLPNADPAPQIAAPKLTKARPLERRAFITGQV
ncbi:MAG: [NiFe]-hydrogenase assembly chaperone HybE [Rhodobacteraceae bacterium]|nr:[NiFe]-hydrogenase assembly chaperone HybE [Paracoccaceae bacterium]